MYPKIFCVTQILDCFTVSVEACMCPYGARMTLATPLLWCVLITTEKRRLVFVNCDTTDHSKLSFIGIMLSTGILSYQLCATITCQGTLVMKYCNLNKFIATEPKICYCYGNGGPCIHIGLGWAFPKLNSYQGLNCNGDLQIYVIPVKKERLF